jgi:hypothetical protein
VIQAKPAAYRDYRVWAKKLGLPLFKGLNCTLRIRKYPILDSSLDCTMFFLNFPRYTSAKEKIFRSRSCPRFFRTAISCRNRSRSGQSGRSCTCPPGRNMGRPGRGEQEVPTESPEREDGGSPANPGDTRADGNTVNPRSPWFPPDP